MCDKLLRLGFKMGNNWYTFDPNFKKIDSSDMQSPDAKGTWSPSKIRNLATDDM